MKSRILTVAALAVIVFSCATKKEAPKVVAVAEPVKAVELTPVVVSGQDLYGNNCGQQSFTSCGITQFPSG